MSNKILDLIISFPNPKGEILEYDTKKIELDKITEYYNSQPTLDDNNFQILDEYNIKKNNILLPDLTADINWCKNTKTNLLNVLNYSTYNEIYKEYLIVNFSLDNKNYFYFKKNRNNLLINKRHPFFIFSEITVEYHESLNNVNVFSLDWDFCLLEENDNKNIKLFCKKDHVPYLITEKEGEDLCIIFAKKLENKYQVKFSTDYNNIKNYIPKSHLKDIEIINTMLDEDLPEKEEILIHIIKKSGDKRYPDNIHFIYNNHSQEQCFHLDNLKHLTSFIVNKLYKGHGSKTVHLTQNKENVIYKIKKDIK